MKKLEISTKIALGTAFFFLVALIISQWCFYNKANHFVEEIRKLHIQRDSVLALLDTSKVSEQYITLQQESQEFQTERFTVELEKQKQSLFTYFIGFLGIGTLAGFFVILFLIPKEIEKRAKLEVDEKIGDAIRGRSETIRYLLNTYDEESFLRQNKRIYIKGETDKEKVRAILIENGMNPENIYLDEDTAKRNKYDIVFFNNFNGELLPAEPPKKQNAKEHDEAEDENKHEAFQKILEVMQAEKQSICFFYYNETNVIFPNWKIQDYGLKKRINFATNPAQIYGNLLNTLKYQDKLQQRQ